MMAPVALDCRVRGFSRARLKAGLNAALDELALGHAELSVVVVDEPAIRAANRRFFGRDIETDVISVSQIEGAPAGPPERLMVGRVDPAAPELIGDVIVSWDAAQHQAARHGHTPEEELLFLAVHGLLHNLGLDDAAPAGRRRMDRIAGRILGKVKQKHLPRRHGE